jgi:hypothetical protein
LLSIFGINDMGNVPRSLSDQIVGTFDIEQLCLLNRELILGSNNTSPGVGGIIFTGAQVPPGELWYVWTYGIRAPSGVLPAGESIRFVPCVTAQGAVIPIAPPRSGSPGEQVAAATEGKFWLGPGAGLGVVVEQETGAAKTLTWYAVIVRLKI